MKDSQGWISVEDKMPEKGEKVLVLIDGHHEFAEYLNRGWHVLGTRKELTHWMPLPETPERQTTDVDYS